MSKTKLTPEDLTPENIKAAQDIVRAVIKMQTEPADPFIGQMVVREIMKLSEDSEEKSFEQTLIDGLKEFSDNFCDDIVEAEVKQFEFELCSKLATSIHTAIGEKLINLKDGVLKQRFANDLVFGRNVNTPYCITKSLWRIIDNIFVNDKQTYPRFILDLERNMSVNSADVFGALDQLLYASARKFFDDHLGAFGSSRVASVVNLGSIEDCEGPFLINSLMHSNLSMLLNIFSRNNNVYRPSSGQIASNIRDSFAGPITWKENPFGVQLNNEVIASLQTSIGAIDTEQIYVAQKLCNLIHVGHGVRSLRDIFGTDSPFHNIRLNASVINSLSRSIGEVLNINELDLARQFKTTYRLNDVYLTIHDKLCQYSLVGKYYVMLFCDIEDELDDNSLGDIFWNLDQSSKYAEPELLYCGIFWSFWLTYYLIAQAWGCEVDQKKLALLYLFCRYCPIIGFQRLRYDDTRGRIVILPKPKQIEFSEIGMTEGPIPLPIFELHADGKPAVSYPGFDLYFWHNVAIPEYMGQVPSKEWKSEWLITEQNTEIRRILIENVGYEKIFKQLRAASVNSWREYELIRIIDSVDLEPISLLKMTCPSTGSVHVLRVPPETKTAREGITWCNHGIDPEEFVREC